MPRDGSGNYTLPAGNPVVTGTTITSAWANATMPDIGNEITNSLDRNGRGGMLAPLTFADGTGVAPSVSFTSEPTLGLYRQSAGHFGFAAGGAGVVRMGSALQLEVFRGAVWDRVPSIAAAETITGDWTFNGALSGTGLDAYAALADNETVTGDWTFNGTVSGTGMDAYGKLADAESATGTWNFVTDLTVAGNSVYHAGNPQPAPTFGGLSDVTITGVTSGELVAWSGSAWINQTLAEAGVEPAFSKNTGFNLVLGTGSGQVAEGNHLHTGVYEPADANIVKSDTAVEFTAGVGSTKVTLTDAATVAINAALGNAFNWTVGGSRTLGFPTNLEAGSVRYIDATVDGTGGYTLALGSGYTLFSGTFDGTALKRNRIWVVARTAALADVYIEQAP